MVSCIVTLVQSSHCRMWARGFGWGTVWSVAFNHMMVAENSWQIHITKRSSLAALFARALSTLLGVGWNWSQFKPEAQETNVSVSLCAFLTLLYTYILLSLAFVKITELVASWCRKVPISGRTRLVGSAKRERCPVSTLAFPYCGSRERCLQ